MKNLHRTIGASPPRIAMFVCALAMLVCGALPSFAGAAAVPAWNLQQTSMPTTFVPGSVAIASSAFPRYVLTVSNVGGRAAEGEVTIKDELPAGLKPAENALPSIRSDLGVVEECAEPIGQVVTCSLAATVPSGGFLYVVIPLEVSATPPSEVTNHVSVSGGGAAQVALTETTATGTESSGFGLVGGRQGLMAVASTESGKAPQQAGSHPEYLVLDVETKTRPAPGAPATEGAVPVGALKKLGFTLPEGFVFDPSATTVRCTDQELLSAFGRELGCPLSSQVGEVLIRQPVAVGALSVPLYNLVPPPGVPAELGFNALGVTVHVAGGLSGDFHLTATTDNILGKLFTAGTRVVLWGNPSSASHDLTRVGTGGSASCRNQTNGRPEEACPVLRSETPLLTMPSACSSALPLSASVNSWQESPAAEPVVAATTVEGPAEASVGVTGCQALKFQPTVSVQPTTAKAASPSGLAVHLEIPQNQGVTNLATATQKKVVVRLPEGMTVNPSAAEGLGACPQAQIGIGSNSPADCPDASKIGTAEVSTPLLESPLKGSVFLAEQANNPFGTLLALYIVVESEGVVIKLPGRVDTDAATGRITATFDNNPQLPFSDLKVDLNGGSRATLTTPAACGRYDIQTEITSWASPNSVSITSPMQVTEGCSTGGFAPKLEAGTANPVAGSYSPFTLRVTRQDGEQNISRISATLPNGLLAKLAGIPLCPENQAASGDCASASQIGTTTTGIGAGTQPLYIPQAGKSPTAVYLAGPYKGAPYSLVVKVPAQAGPFDLGTIAVRVALNVDTFTAQVTASSDPLPQILEGIPVSYRDIRVNASRSDFIINPTNCEPIKVTSTIAALNGASADPTSRFQVAGCASLAFKPGLKLSLKGETKRTGHPALKAVVTYPSKGSFANIARAQVNLPHAEFLDQGNLNKTCTKPVLLEGKCPKSAVYGKVKAWTPLLDRPLEGNVYLVGGFGYKLPALVAELNGQIRILLKGKVDSGPNKGIRNTFEAVPDAPVSRFVLEMKGGKKYGLFENSEPLCGKPQQAIVRFTGQNGQVEQTKPRIAVSCKGVHKGKGKDR